LKLEVAGRSVVGRRKNNEDAFLLDRRRGVFVVADGMGGYEGGEVASRLVIETVSRFFEDNDEDADVTWPWGLEEGRSFVENLLAVALRMANRTVFRQRAGKLAQMGSTAVAVALDDTRAVIAHVGDSRAYRLRQGRLEALTRDHSLVEQMRDMGFEEVPDHMGHVITKAIGFDVDTQPELRVMEVRPGDTLLLCTDGLTDPLADAEIARFLSGTSVELACSELLDAAYAAGGSDNITALVLRFAP